MVRAVLKASYQPSTGGQAAGDRDLLSRVPDAPENNPVMDEDDAQRQKLLKLVHSICEWLYPSANCHARSVLLRTYAFVWFVRPHWLGSPTQVELARQLKVSKQTIGKVLNQLRDKFGLAISGMRTDAAREKFAVNARAHAGALAEARRRAHQTRKEKAQQSLNKRQRGAFTAR